MASVEDAASVTCHEILEAPPVPSIQKATDGEAAALPSVSLSPGSGGGFGSPVGVFGQFPFAAATASTWSWKRPMSKNTTSSTI